MRNRGRLGDGSARPAFLLLGALFALTVAGCGQPPPSNAGQGGGGANGANEAASEGATGGETTAEETTTEETTAEETTAEGTTSEETTGVVAVGGSPELAEAADGYEEYVVEQVALLEKRTEAFTDAVISGDVSEAKRLFGPTREPWERIEPIAAALGDYDPKIDAREGDVPDGEWRGFHRIEKALWVENTTEGQEEYARQLMEDVSNLREEVEGLELAPEDLVTGSVELLNEVSAGKIRGEEDRYSHTDLYDINANIEGSEAAFEELKPEVAGEDLSLANEVEEGFDGVYEELDQYRKGDGWVSYEKLNEADRRALSQKVDALAESLSRVGQVLEG
ncbi:MAG: EfeM/EfeO family lipoprotein [Actinomycetota bacterium]|nr:EfeM/EfeO family lipoprotein [Actinomycetota bacterium]